MRLSTDGLLMDCLCLLSVVCLLSVCQSVCHWAGWTDPYPLPTASTYAVFIILRVKRFSLPSSSVMAPLDY